MKNKINYPDWICNACGMQHGKWYVDGNYIGPKHHYATYHINTCDVCKQKDVSVTEPRDFGHLQNTWKLK